MQEVALWMNTVAVSWARRAVLACALLLAAAGVASADVTYDYTGLAFDSSSCLFRFFCAPFAPGPGPIRVSFTEATPLPANLTGPIYGIMANLALDPATTPTSFTISDGLFKLSGFGAGSNVYVETGPTGNIIAWNIGFNGGDIQMTTINSTGATPGNPVTVSDGSATFCVPSFQCETFNYINGSPGTWTSPGGAATPEPTSLLLLGTGLISAAALRRRRAR